MPQWRSRRDSAGRQQPRFRRVRSVEAGRSGGGNSKGYDVRVGVSEIGELDRGARTVNESEGQIVRGIFEWERRLARSRSSLVDSSFSQEVSWT